MIRMSQEKIELHPAFVWDCPGCGNEVFSRGEHPEMTLKELAELKEKQGIESWEIGDYFIQTPDKVQCPHCQQEFSTGEA